MVTVSSRLETLFDSVPAVMDVFSASLHTNVQEMGRLFSPTL
jgi:hypothetical protein